MNNRDAVLDFVKNNDGVTRQKLLVGTSLTPGQIYGALCTLLRLRLISSEDSGPYKHGRRAKVYSAQEPKPEPMGSMELFNVWPVPFQPMEGAVRVITHDREGYRI